MLLALVAWSCLQSAPPAPRIERVERLVGLCKLWGFAKFSHPWLAHEPIDWDLALIEVLPAVEDARDVAGYRAALDALLAKLVDPATHLAGASAAAPARRDAAARVEVEAQGELATITATDWSGILADERFFQRAFERCASATNLVLDVRRGGAVPPWEADDVARRFSEQLRAELATLLDREVQLAGERSVDRSGFPPSQGATSGGYFAVFDADSGETWEPREPRRDWVRVAIVTDGGSRRLGPVLDALQHTGRAFVVHESSDTTCFLDAQTSEVELPYGLVARVRTSEPVFVGEQLAFVPAATVEPVAGRDAALERARAIARGEETPPAPRPSAHAVSEISTKEDPYSDLAAPPREYRLLALFRSWNVLRRFFPYQHLMERSLDDLLPEAIAKFDAAQDAVAYQRAVLEFTAQLRDSHVWVNGGYAAQLVLGATHGPPIAVASWSAGCVVVQVLDEALEQSGSVVRGDVLLSIDGRTIDERRAELGRLVSAATPQALAWNTDRGLLLGGPKDSRCALKLRRLDGSVQEVELTRTREAAELWAVRPRPHPSLPPFTVLPSGLGYFDLVQLERAQVDEAFEAVRETPGLILDLRGYPRGTAWAICGRLTNETFVMARFRRPRWAAGGPDEYTFEQPIDASGPWRYEAPIAVLVDNNAISQSEHSCLGFEGAARGRVTFVGAPTMGANGDVTNVVLPGNVYVSFSGHDVRHADGRQLQRVGIQPDVRVEPTIEGWLAGRDEVLDAAVELLTREK